MDGQPQNGSSLIPLGGDWVVWPVAMLRSAGLPVAELLEFIEAVEEAGDDAEKLRALLEQVAANSWLLEALTWQNPKIVTNWLHRYSVSGAPQHVRSRKKLRELGAYLQRYTTKNETVGFYGPTGWAVVDPSSDCAVVTKGNGARVWADTAFEPWAITALAETWAENSEVRWYLPVTLSQAGVLDGDSFLRPRRGPWRLTPDQKQVVEALAARPDHATELLSKLGETWHRNRLGPVLEELQKADCLQWGFDLPNERDLENRVMTQVDLLPEGDLRSTVLDGLASFLGLRDDVARALGDATRTVQAMERLRLAFERTTGRKSTVSKKTNPDSRTLLYHDVAVDWQAVVGGRSLDELRGPLELLMTLSRYVTWKLAEEIDDLARTALVSGEDSFEAVFDELGPAFTLDGSADISRKVMADVHRKVDSLLATTEPHHRTDNAVMYQSDALRERWLNTFDAPRHGWTAAALHGPDLMVARDGDRPTWVLGELHLAVNALDSRFCLDGQPVPGQIEALIEGATPRRFIPAFPDYWPRKSPRTYPPPAHYIPDKHRYWTLWSSSIVSESVPKLSCVNFTVVDRNDEVLVLDGEGQPLARLVDFVGEFLSLAFLNSFSLRPKVGYQQRLSFDGVVVERRSWRFPIRQLPLAGDDSLRVFFEDRGVPRRIFVHVPGEPKPVFCDTYGSITTDNVVRMLRKVTDPCAHVEVQEMFPEIEHLWLRDANGEPVTSEFRFVIQDMRASTSRSS